MSVLSHGIVSVFTMGHGQKYLKTIILEHRDQQGTGNEKVSKLSYIINFLSKRMKKKEIEREQNQE